MEGNIKLAQNKVGCDKPGIHLVRIETASCGNGYEPSDSLRMGNILTA
jgi:hypothetical protein